MPHIKTILTVLLAVLLIQYNMYSQQTPDTNSTSTVWNCNIQWQGQVTPTQFYLIMKSNNTAQIVTFEGNRVIKENATWTNNNNQIFFMLSNETVQLQTLVNTSQFNGTCSNLSNGITGSWSGTISVDVTENSIRQMITNTISKKNR
ncbi:MAG: hypothetical protein JNJ85_13545 [Candidatus Kapabacteria bacterium]|nr:hypothetical protein [Candidatus Kapabacteria bacterium]